MLGWGTSDFFAGLSSKKVGHLKTFFWSQLAGLVSALLLLFFLKSSFNTSFLIFILLIIASIFYTVAYLLYYQGFELGNISIISATMNLWAVFTMVFAFLFLGQRLSSQQTLGASLIVTGITLAALKWSDFKKQKISLLAGVKETVFSALIIGLFWNMSQIISAKIGWIPTTIFVKVGVILFLSIFSSFTKQPLNLKKINKQTKFLVILTGILEAIGIASVNWGLTIGDVILVSPISSALSIITITMAIIFAKEKITKTQALGILVTFAGIILTAL